MAGPLKTSEVTEVPQNVAWRPDDVFKQHRTPDRLLDDVVFHPEILDVIEKKIEEMDDELRALSMDIHDHPEIRFEERYAHDTLTVFMRQHGFDVTEHYLLDTAWKATYAHGQDGRTIGINCEMDALAGIGHACGHNLIAMSGVAVACAVKAAMETFQLSGKICVLGTPAEEGGSGKIILLDRGAYEGMDACVMCHPAPGPQFSLSLSSSLAIQRAEVEYFGHTAHAALAPWEARNALDAAVLAYNNVSALRQQLKPTYRVHGVFEGRNWSHNVIPDYAKYIVGIRTPVLAELRPLVKRVVSCLEASALATGCRADIHTLDGTYDLRQNKVLGEETAHVFTSRYGPVNFAWGIGNASTDFGNVTYALPALHPSFAIPTVPGGSNHTVEFAKAAATMEAHRACLNVSKALAATSVRVLIDDGFFAKVKQAFEQDKKDREKEANAAMH